MSNPGVTLTSTAYKYAGLAATIAIGAATAAYRANSLYVKVPAVFLSAFAAFTLRMYVR